MDIATVSNLAPHPSPSVGIFWGVRTGDRLILACHGASVTSIKPIEGFIDYELGHAEIWERWQRLGAMGLTRQGLPLEILSTEYDQHPRGRLLVVDAASNRFILYADRKLQSPAIVSKLLESFCVDPSCASVQSDSHYRS
jgi:hypothetical protein